MTHGAVGSFMRAGYRPFFVGLALVGSSCSAGGPSQSRTTSAERAVSSDRRSQEQTRGVITPEPAFDAPSALASIAEPSACAARVNYEGNFESCEGEVVAQGAAVLVRVVTECGQDSCSVSAWLWHAGGIVKLSLYDGGGIAVDPKLGFYVVDVRDFDDEEDMMASFYTRAPELQRVPLTGGEPALFAPCMSPSLAPNAEYFVCRNRHGDVLQLPVVGGPLELLSINDNPEAEQWSPYAYLYPDSVTFSESATPGAKRTTAAARFGARATTFEWPPPSPSAELPHQPGPLLTLAITQATRIAQSELLIVAGPALRLLQQGRLVFEWPYVPFTRKGRCCDAEGGATMPSLECERPAVASAAWYEPQHRTVVLVSGNPEGPVGCADPSRFDVVRLPHGALPTLRH